MLALAVTIAAVLAVLVALLAVPVVLAVDAERVDKLEARWRGLWLFGLVDIRLSGGQNAPSAPERSDAARAAGWFRRAKERGTGLRMGVAVLRTRGFLQRVVRLVSDLLRQVKLERFHLRADFGFDNPADTGVFYGMLWPLLVMADVRGLDVHCSPMFLKSGVKGIIGATVQVRPLSVVATVTAFLFSRPVFRAAGSAWRARK